MAETLKLLEGKTIKEVKLWNLDELPDNIEGSLGFFQHLPLIAFVPTEGKVIAYNLEKQLSIIWNETKQGLI